jgi:acyl transferase domain-containing protein
MDPVLAELGVAAGRLEYGRPQVPWACGLTGELLPECDAGYWVAQARQPVRFADAVMTLAAQGVSVFIEVGPDGTLSALGPDALGGADGQQDARPVFIPVLRPGQPDAAALTAALARAYVHGVRVDWPAVTSGGRRVDLPTYAFQHERYWPSVQPLAAVMPVAGGDGAEAGFWAAVERQDLAGVAGMSR